MSSKPLILKGIVSEPVEHDDGLLREWRREKQQLEDDLRKTRRELEDVRLEKERMERSVKKLREVLTPLHHWLRALFGEIEFAVGAEEPPTPGNSSTANGRAVSDTDPRWQSYKENFPGAPARIIDALLSHREMTLTQLSRLLKMDYTTAQKALSKLKAAGAVRKEGKGPVTLNV